MFYQRDSMPEIRPVTDLRAHSADISRKVTEDKTPVILTKNGYANMVVLSYEQYVELNARKELYRLLDEGSADIAAGKVQPFGPAMKKLREEIENGTI